MKIYFKLLILLFFLILLVNIIGLVVSLTVIDSLILKVKPLNRAYVFAHGNYDCFENSSYAHFTILNGEKFSTRLLLDGLRSEGYNYIWISMCEQGNSDFVVDYKNGTRILWGGDVDRVGFAGRVYPFFYGLGFYRNSFGNGYENTNNEVCV